MVIAKTVWSADGKVLLAEGTALTPAYIRSLIERNIMAVHVRDASDVFRAESRDDPAEVIVEEARGATPLAIARLTKIVAWGMHPRTTDSSAAVSRRQQARALAQARLALEDDPTEMPLDRLYRDITTIIDQVLAPRVVTALDALKEHSPQTFQHSLDATIVSILIAKQIGLGPPLVRCLALGALLHDVGKLHVAPAILEKPAQLTRDELAEVKQHPTIGYEMVREFPIRNPLPAAIVLQHHEHQDGTGYPNGLTGTNSIIRTREQRFQPGRITLLAEIVAVADVYSALVSERPYRPAFSPGQVVVMLQYLAGSHLNRELVEAMLQVRPAFPVGRWVEVVSGSYAGWQGVVVRISLVSPTRPVIRLLVDREGNLVSTGVELDLQAEPAIEIAPLPEDEAA